MVEADILVGAVAIAIGSVVMLAAVFNWQWYYDLQKARWVESFFGRKGARLVFALLGLSLIVLGSAIAIGILRRSALSAARTRLFDPVSQPQEVFLGTRGRVYDAQAPIQVAPQITGKPTRSGYTFGSHAGTPQGRI